jgi:hypothetical protein
LSSTEYSAGDSSISVEAAVPCEEMQETPDYIRRGAAPRHKIAPVELFSAPSSPPERGTAAVGEEGARIGGALESEAAGGGVTEQGSPHAQEVRKMASEWYHILHRQRH